MRLALRWLWLLLSSLLTGCDLRSSCVFIAEISCGDPLFKANANMLWDGTSHVGSQVFYLCEEGFRTKGQRNSSVCGDDGRWEDIDLACEGAASD